MPTYSGPQIGELRGVAGADISDQLNNSLAELAANFGFETDGFLVGMSLSLCHTEGKRLEGEDILVSIRKLDPKRCPAKDLDELNNWLDQHDGTMPIITYHKAIPVTRVLECFKDITVGLVQKKLRVKKLDVTDSISVD